MTEIFLHIVNMSITATILAVVVLLLRLLLKKAPKWISVLLWGLVALRLICPFAVESPFSLMPKTDWVVQEPLMEEDLFLNSAPDSIPAFDSSSFGSDITVQYSYYPLENSNIEIHRGISISFILSCIWAAGMAALLLHTVISTIRLRKSIGAAIRIQDNVWESSAVESPFVLGMIRPRIYVPRGMSEEKLAYVIAHEQAHIRRKDHWWKPLGFLLLTIHWFNPVLWLAYILLCRDIEMACDERVIKEYDDVQRADYSEALLDCSVKSSRSRQMITACPLAFGEVSVKERIKSVLHYKKPAFWIVVLAVIACVVTAACFLTNPQQDLSVESVSRVTYNEMDVSDIYVQELVTLINDSGKTCFPVGADDPNDLSVSIQIDCEDGSMYLLHYQYYSGFSFSPAHPGEDDYRSILTYFSPDGKGSKAWRLEYDFDAKFKKWLVAVRAEPGIPYIPETDTQSGKQLTLEDVITLSAKGEDLIWSDFAGYSHTDIGSGLFIWHLPIDEVFSVKVGGGSVMTEPMYVYLCAGSGDAKERIDIRDGGVEEFIESIEKTLLNISKPVEDYQNDIIEHAAESIFGAVTVYASGIDKLDQVPTGTVGLSEEILLYRLDYWITKGINGLTGTPPEDIYRETVYFAMFNDWTSDTWVRLGTITEDEMDAKYGTAEMISKYGNKFTAAASQMKQEYYELVRKNPVEFTAVITKFDPAIRLLSMSKKGRLSSKKSL